MLSVQVALGFGFRVQGVRAVMKLMWIGSRDV